MHKEMRRKDRAITREEARAVLEKCEYGILALTDGDNGPYAVPLSYIVMDNAIYFHCALTGEKIDCISACPAACFTVVGNTEPVFDKGFSTFYESCMVFGNVRLVTDDQEKHTSLIEMCRKYLPDHMDQAEEYTRKQWKATAVYAMDIERITGKSKKRP